jgi:hypothetical protein
MADSVSYRCFVAAQSSARQIAVKGVNGLPDRNIAQACVMLWIKSADPGIGEGLALAGDLMSDAAFAEGLLEIVGNGDAPGQPTEVEITLRRVVAAKGADPAMAGSVPFDSASATAPGAVSGTSSFAPVKRSTPPTIDAGDPLIKTS